MSNFIVNGGNKLKGEITTNTAKNSAVAILCASAMIEGRTTLTNVPVIEEVKRLVEILNSIGIRTAWTGEHELEIVNNFNITLEKLNRESFIKTRSGLMLMGSLLAVFNEFSLPHGTGCNLGLRTVNPYIIALEHLGIKVKKTTDAYYVRKINPNGKSFTMYESSDTGTELVIMAACLIPGVTEIEFASCNYMTQDLCYFLLRAGAKIEGIGTTKLRITGVEKLQPVTNYPIMPDPIESMALISIAITTKSKILIKECPIEFLRLELEKLRVMGQQFTISNPYKSKNGQFDLVDIEVIPSDLLCLPDKIYGRPFPGLNIDNLPLFLPILTQAEGSTLVFDWSYENRAIYFTELNKLGANVMLHDPHRVTVTGITELKPAEIVCPPALRPSINLLICMLGAKGKSTLRNTYAIDRGYENIYGRLNELGTDIKKLK